MNQESDNKLNRQLEEYRQRVLRETYLVNLRGIPLPENKSGRPMTVDIPLGKVYIRFRAVEEKVSVTKEQSEIHDIKGSSPDRLSTSRSKADSPRYLRDFGEYLYQQTQVYKSFQPSKVIDPETAICDNSKVILLGAAGSGKSTLLRYIAHEYAKKPSEKIPIFVPLVYATSVLLKAA
jgi:ABC-type glutathione transport system ATPase component